MTAWPWRAGLVSLVGTSFLCALAATGVPAAAQGTAPQTVDPATTADQRLITLATGLAAQLETVIAQTDAEIRRQEEAAGFSASQDALDQIEALRQQRATFEARLTEVRTLLTDLREAD